MFNDVIEAGKDQISARVAAYYRQKYPRMPEHREAPEEIRMTPDQLIAENEALSAGLYRAIQNENEKTMAGLAAVFAKRKALKEGKH